MTVYVDAHHHVWQLALGFYDWLTPELPIHRDFGLADLRPLLGEIGASVLVQAAPREAETKLMLDTARHSDGLVLGVVGWTDLAAADAPRRVAALAGETLLKGLRPMLQDIPQTDWILRPDVQPGLTAMADHGLRFDALVQPRHLPVLLKLAAAHPDLPIVVDHAAKPAIAAGRFHPWAEDIARLARESHVTCKLSGLVTEAASDWQPDNLRPYVDHLLACFGPQRLMWGSDWPVAELGGGFRRWRQACVGLLSGLSAADRDAIFGGTAMAFYGLTTSA